MGVQLVWGGDMILNRALNRIDRFANGNARSIAHAENMRIHRLRGLPPPHVQDHIRGFAPYPWQRLKRGARGRHDTCLLYTSDAADE